MQIKTNSTAVHAPFANAWFVTDDPELNPAIARCLAARLRTHKASLQKGETTSTASALALSAYLDALPPLSDPDNIRDFIACVTHGYRKLIIQDWQVPRLMYAAHIALTACQFQQQLQRAA